MYCEDESENTGEYELNYFCKREMITGENKNEFSKLIEKGWNFSKDEEQKKILEKLKNPSLIFCLTFSQIHKFLAQGQE